MQLDLDFIRSQFPAFSEPALAGQSFFENAGGSFTCRQVIDRLFRFYNERKVQPYAPYDASRLGGEEMDEARRRLSAMMGVHEDELSFGPSTTQNVYVLAKAFGEWMNEGDAIIVTNQDHEANSGAWRRLTEHGIEVREWQINPETGRLDTSDLMNLLDALRTYPKVSNSERITFEYVMLKDVNDTDADARRLVKLIKGIPAKINLIPFNEWPGSPYERSDWSRIEAFADIIYKAGYASPIRTPRGEDIMAACGQLKSATERARKSKKAIEAEAGL